LWCNAHSVRGEGRICGRGCGKSKRKLGFGADRRMDSWVGLWIVFISWIMSWYGSYTLLTWCIYKLEWEQVPGVGDNLRKVRAGDSLCRVEAGVGLWDG